MALTATIGQQIIPREYRWLRRRLGQVRRSAKVVIFVDAFVYSALMLLAITPIALIVDNLFHLPNAVRMVLLGALGIGALTLFIWRARMALKTWTDERVARRIEECYPELENRLINALQLGRYEPNERTTGIITRIIEDAAQFSSRMSFGDAIRLKRLLRALLVMAGLIGVTALYPILFYDYFSNAARRILFPNQDIPPVSLTFLNVYPDRDLRLGKGDALDIKADLASGYRSPKEALIELAGNDRPQSTPMRFDGERFMHRIADVQQNFSFRVKADDFISTRRRVTVVDKPRVELTQLIYEYPAYTGQDIVKVENSDGVIQGLVGTTVTVTAITNKPLKNMSLDLSGGTTPTLRHEAYTTVVKDPGGAERKIIGERLQTSLVLRQNDSYRIHLTDEESFTNEPAPAHGIIVLPDEAPRIAVSSPAGEAQVEVGSKISILFSCTDDYGIAQVYGTLRESNATGEGKNVYSDKPSRGTRRIQNGFDLDLKGYKAETDLVVQIFARDTNPAGGGSLSESEPVTIHVVAPGGVQQPEGKSDAATVFQRLAALLAEQRDARLRTDRLVSRGAENKLTEGRAKSTLPRIEQQQDLIREEAKRIAESIPEKDAELATVKTTLDGLIKDPMAQAITIVSEAGKFTDISKIDESLKEAVKLQDKIIAALEKLLEEKKEAPGVKENDDKEKKDRLEIKPGEKVDEEKAKRYVEGVIEKLDKFAEFDKKMIDAARELAKKKPEDLTKDEVDKLNEIAAAKEDWTQFMRNVFSDLTRMSEVKPVDTAQAEEIVEIYAEIELRPKELQDKKKEIFVPVEDGAAAELAKELQANLEKWLEDQKDAIKWNMEEMDKPFEPPLAELPKELEDLIGDLLESEEDMNDDIEDVTSSMADSIDKGAGWGTADGPISNFSAQGKTGNVMPNNNEMTGRACEGRSGNSNVEFVEKQAYGKGGRKTPTRLGEESYENGKVEDFSTDPTGGATGGGKESGYGARGLTSPHAAPMDGTQKRLMDKQADLKMKATNIEKMLTTQNLPAGQMGKAIEKLNVMEAAIVEKRYNELPRINEQVITNIHDNQKLVNKQIEANREKRGKLPQRFNQDIATGLRDQLPEGYEEMIKDYYKGLSEAMR
ncbi:MAG: hypothetical protein NTX50_27860 [Candidatus Sumerlaeota bacterium]|nr:hypothetical protein [Candidatus Sumerlaeota bacterium]